MSAAADLPADLTEALDRWRAEDPDPVTRAALDDLRDRATNGDQAASAELRSAFAGPLEFGTAGLRGALGPGPARMNRVVVGRAAAGLAAHLDNIGASGGTVLIGYDARNNSDVFARDTAEILAGKGFRALLTPSPVPTPVVAFGIGHFDCVAAVVVTASHNPPQDNGYKVYLGDGSQIIPPSDSQIAAQIAAVAERPLAEVPRSEDYTVLGDDLVQAYLDRVSSLVADDGTSELDRVRWVYTAMHGVGASLVRRATERAGFGAPVSVSEQEQPDPTFPTVSFPNPEEPGALDLALELASGSDVDLVIANDPDADRCAVAIPVDGNWRMLRGDELGALLGDDTLRRGVRGNYAASVVSSSLLSVMARAAGQQAVTTLTGFKWIGRVPNLAFGYEEALGYCCDAETVPDKDGISALIRVLALAANLKTSGLTIADRLEEIDRTHGVFRTDQISIRVEDLSLITDAMARLRQSPPTSLVGEECRMTDLAAGSAELPPTDGVQLVAEHTTATVRPSGTEPKLKCYLEARLAPSGDLRADRDAVADRLRRLREEMAGLLGL